MTKLVRDLMHPGLIACPPHATLGQVAVLLNQNRVHALIVTNREGRPLGVLSDFDLLAGEWLSSNPESLTVMRKLIAADMMSSPVISVEAGIPLCEAARELTENQISRLLVTENGEPVGVIALSDFVASLAREEKPRRETVGDVMSAGILVCRRETPIRAAARAMTDAKYRSVLVVNAKGKPLGVVSGMDLLPFVKDDMEEARLVSDIMHPALTIDVRASLREAADRMIQNHHHRLIVVDDANPENFPLGVISSFDIVAEMARPGSVWQM